MKFLSSPPEDTKGHEKGFQRLAPPCVGGKDKGGMQDRRGWLVGSSAVPQPARLMTANSGLSPRSLASRTPFVGMGGPQRLLCYKKRKSEDRTLRGRAVCPPEGVWGRA